MEAPQKSQIILFNRLPAVAIGGPPHSGKSVLAYSLTQTLRELDVSHYLLRAYPPDYEGDWFLEGEPDTVRHLRLKGALSEAWLPLLKRDVARRHLPLIVDMGGMPTLEQERILDECTHAILLTPNEQARQEWSSRFARHGLVLLADLHSALAGENCLETSSPLLVGTLAGLERGKLATGPAFDALVNRLTGLFAFPDLEQEHLENAPVELVVHLERLAAQMGWDANELRPQDLPSLLDYLPPGRPLALYGRGPNWLYAAVAAHTLPSPFFLFDVRLGWVEAPAISIGKSAADCPVATARITTPDTQILSFGLPHTYVDITEADQICLPPCPGGGAILSGKLPHWLLAGLVRACDAPWVAVVQPQVEGAVVVKSCGGQPAVGRVLPVPQVL